MFTRDIFTCRNERIYDPKECPQRGALGSPSRCALFERPHLRLDREARHRLGIYGSLSCYKCRALCMEIDHKVLYAFAYRASFWKKRRTAWVHLGVFVVVTQYDLPVQCVAVCCSVLQCVAVPKAREASLCELSLLVGELFWCVLVGSLFLLRFLIPATVEPPVKFSSNTVHFTMQLTSARTPRISLPLTDSEQSGSK